MGRGSGGSARPRAWALAAVGLAAAAAFVAAGLWLRSGSTSVRRAELVAILGDVTQALPGQASRGRDGRSAALDAAAADVSAGRLEVRQRDRCTPDEIARYGAADGAGRLRVFAVRHRGGAEAYLWDEGGREVVAASVRDGREVEPLALSRAGAEAALGACTAPAR